jgi:hypothetical protein
MPPTRIITTPANAKVVNSLAFTEIFHVFITILSFAL